MKRSEEKRLKFIFGCADDRGIVNSTRFQLLQENALREYAGVCSSIDCINPACAATFSGDIFNDADIRDLKHWNVYCFKHREKPLRVSSGKAVAGLVNARGRYLSTPENPVCHETEFYCDHIKRKIT